MIKAIALLKQFLLDDVNEKYAKNKTQFFTQTLELGGPRCKNKNIRSHVDGSS